MIGQVGLGAELGEIPAACLDLGGRPRGKIGDDGQPGRVAEGVEDGREVDLVAMGWGRLRTGLT